jgi:prepilin-type N-terminal cleavage/methylation domain-containing protein
MTEPSSESGFSLVELLVAMVITLIVSGAIYGLMTAGQNAFRREPELAERQQNIRLAMDMIVRDLANAGTGLPPFTQVFTMNLGDAAASPPGPSGAAHSDDLEMLSVTGRDSEPVCQGTNNGLLTEASLVRNSIDVPLETMVFLVFSTSLTSGPDVPSPVHDDMWTSRRVTGVGPSSPTPPPSLTWDRCESTPGSNHAVLHFADTNPQNRTTLCQNSPIEPRGNYPGTGCGTNVLTRVVFGRQVRYQVRSDAEGVPVLERIATDNADLTPQVLARGIEEMQIQYTTFADPATWLDQAPDVADPANEDWNTANAAGKFSTIVNRVRVTLTSRSEARNIQGAVNRADATDPRLRGSLSSTVSPRAALLSITYGRPSPDPGGVWE